MATTTHQAIDNVTVKNALDDSERSLEIGNQQPSYVYVSCDCVKLLYIGYHTGDLDDSYLGSSRNSLFKPEHKLTLSVHSNKLIAAFVEAGLQSAWNASSSIRFANLQNAKAFGFHSMSSSELSAFNRQRWACLKHKAKVSKALSISLKAYYADEANYNAMLERNRNPLRNAKQSQSKAGITFSQEHKDNISKSRLGVPNSEECKAKKRISNKESFMLKVIKDCQYYHGKHYGKLLKQYKLEEYLAYFNQSTEKVQRLEQWLVDNKLMVVETEGASYLACKI